MGFGAALCRLLCVSTPAESRSIQDSTPTMQSRCASFVGQLPATTTRYDVCQVTSINMLHDDVLLDIFGFYVIRRSNYEKEEIEAWQTLVHVCRQWRTVVFGSPRRLRLRLYCATKTQTPLDVSPALPLRIEGGVGNTEELDNIVAVLERSNRVYHIDLADYSSYLEDILAPMQEPFPELTYLRLFSTEAATVVPDSFLGGYAPPRLRELTLDGIPFPGLPKLLLSPTQLTYLLLFNIPHSGYFSPEAISTTLSTLTSLRHLVLKFQSPRSLPDGESRHPPPLLRSVLPALRTLRFKGVGEYLEDLVARIDAPRLYSLTITMFNQILFDTPHFIQFVSRTPTLKALKKARLAFRNDAAAVVLSSPPDGYKELEVEILCRQSDWQVSSLEQVCNLCLPSLSALEDLNIHENLKSPPDWRDNIENTLWLEVLRPFSGVTNLYLSEKLAPSIAAALQELVGSRTMEALPALQNIFLEGLQPSGPVQDGIVNLVPARELSGHPITVSLWERDEI